MKKIEIHSIEYNLTEHCNLSCYGCDHNSPLMPERFADLEEFRRDISALAKVAHLEEIVLIGGEPLLHPRICDFLRVARDIGIADRVRVISNGVLLHQVADEFWSLIDMLSLTKYRGVRWRFDEDTLAARCAELGIVLHIWYAPRFYQVMLNRVNHDASLVQEIYDACRTAHDWRCYSVYQGRIYKCSVAPFIPQRLAMLGKRLPETQSDGVLLLDNPRLHDELESYLASARPLAACAACLGSSGVMYEQRQMNQSDCRQWLDEPHDDIARLIEPSRLVVYRGRSVAEVEHTHVELRGPNTANHTSTEGPALDDRDPPRN